MPVLLQRLWIQITADRKRFAALCAMLAVGLLLWSRIILVSKVPRTAVADPAEAAETAKSKRSNGGPIAGSGGNRSGGNKSTATRAPKSTTPGRPGAGAADANKTAESAPKPLGPPLAIKLDGVPVHDPFQINPLFFPKPNQAGSIGQVPAKLISSNAEDRELTDRRQQEYIRTLVDKLTLKAVMQGRQMAIINRRTYRLHESVVTDDADISFELAEVKPDSVVLRFGKQLITLTLATPSFDEPRPSQDARKPGSQPPPQPGGARPPSPGIEGPH